MLSCSLKVEIRLQISLTDNQGLSFGVFAQGFHAMFPSHCLLLYIHFSYLQVLTTVSLTLSFHPYRQIVQWSRAQDRTIYDQLMAGVRYFDLRAVWDGVSELVMV